MKLRIPYVLLAFFAGLLGSHGLVAVDEEDAKLTAFFQRYLDEEFRQRPLEATRLGDHRFDTFLDDVSPQARARWIERYRRTLHTLPEEINYRKLSRGGQIDFDILKSQLTYRLWLAEKAGSFLAGDSAYSYEKDPRAYNDYINDSVFLLLTQSSLPRAVNVRNCIVRMAAIPQVVAAAKASLRNSPRVFLDTAIRQNRGAIAFYEHGIYDVAGETPQLSELRAAAKPVIACLKDYQRYLGRPRSTIEPAQDLPPRSRECHPGSSDALHADDRRGSIPAADQRCLPDGRRGAGQDHSGQAEFLPAFDLLRRPDRPLSTATTDPARTGRQVPAGTLS
jgi:hypothetical protein